LAVSLINPNPLTEVLTDEERAALRQVGLSDTHPSDWNDLKKSKIVRSKRSKRYLPSGFWPSPGRHIYGPKELAVALLAMPRVQSGARRPGPGRPKGSRNKNHLIATG
jgi:hypothetical protein